MAVDITIKNMPPNLYKKLKARAATHRRSVNREVISCLEEVLIIKKYMDTKELLERLEELRNRVPDAPLLTDEFLRKAKEEGRP